jgi:2-polyprenyl-3-methyl-5-hydroxy-6-metoxy-1,4-benzoquinol methylase
MLGNGTVLKGSRKSAAGELAAPRFGVPAVAGAIRDELRRRIRSTGRNGEPPSINWSLLQAELKLLEKSALVGLQLPEMPRFRGIKRFFARLVGRVVLYLGQFVTHQQRQFNCTVLNQLRVLTGAAQILENRQKQLVADMFSRLEDVVGARLGAIEKSSAYVRAALVAQERRIAALFEEGTHLPEEVDPGLTEAVRAEEEREYDGLYLAFENQFRGSREVVRERLKVYLPLLDQAAVGGRTMPILDLGCGRGEWLELLHDEGFVAEGVDCNRVLLDLCRQHDLRVYEGDVLAHLRERPDASLGAVTGFHIIEHLPFPVLLKVLDETVRVLKPGGLAIFETPNPENVLVGACYFYADPTHRNPIFPPTIRFLAEQRGLSDVRVLTLDDHLWTRESFESLPAEHPLASALNPVLNLVKSRFYCGADFAVIGRKAA